MKYILKFKEIFLELKKSIPNYLFKKLQQLRLRSIEEDKKMREVIVRKVCNLISYVDLKNVLENKKPLY